jgi:hypothetical protein
MHTTGIASIIVALGPNLPTVMAGRLLYGIGIGFAMHAAPAYIAGQLHCRELMILFLLCALGFVERRQCELWPCWRRSWCRWLVTGCLSLLLPACLAASPAFLPFFPLKLHLALELYCCFRHAFGGLVFHCRDESSQSPWPAHQPEGSVHCGRHLSRVCAVLCCAVMCCDVLFVLCCRVVK